MFLMNLLASQFNFQSSWFHWNSSKNSQDIVCDVFVVITVCVLSSELCQVLDDHPNCTSSSSNTLHLEISDRQTRTCSSLTVSALPSLNDCLDILLLQSGIAYLSTAETVLSLLLRHSENILRLICLKLLLSPPSDQLRLRIGLYTYIWRVSSF